MVKRSRVDIYHHKSQGCLETTLGFIVLAFLCFWAGRGCHLW